MILSDLKSYLSKRKRAPIGDLVNRFDAEPDALRGMLDHFIRKGQARRLDSDGGACGGCQKCAPLTVEIYEWTGK
ncbi:FeoC-like transcriptional regulator [Varunaivibrio sulfuroxidans]|uniref:FeoC-like transcriptional regulator n=1 Tax=Varunaivibrio sulfuroxidans TaxID=1773489 RepID=A0A4R3JEX0_9PROT|nr:FeoC-like transcriptional regulator [Varunaivibrio sulfuroxidans]TCS64347.1 FeoC-like transcriptional regulator [Varunaivibrio sulfuroxidans]WES31216.1 FeoC-like transcriptional regulator [Varunaivibrio sulfuroxidans]